MTILLLLLAIAGLLASSCSGNSMTNGKESSELQLQITLRQEQISKPTAERLDQMQSMGMNAASLNIQRIYIYLKQPLTQIQANELQVMGITIFLNSWIPPVNNQPTGFLLADVPVDKIDALAAKKYVVRLDTAEKQLQPQSDLPQGG
jgi:hypothetical protein